MATGISKLPVAIFVVVKYPQYGIVSSMYRSKKICQAPVPLAAANT
jgi:hypothetical protein